MTRNVSFSNVMRFVEGDSFVVFLNKCELLTSQDSAAIYLRCGGNYYMGFRFC